IKDNLLIGANGSNERLGAAWGYFKSTVDAGSFSDNNVITGFAIPSTFPLTDFSAWFRANANISLWDNIAVRSIRVERAGGYAGAITISDTATSANVTSAQFKSADVTEISAGNFLLPASAIISLGTPLITTGTVTAYTGAAYISARTAAGFTITLTAAPGSGNTLTIPFEVKY
ncbi:MAG: hypothetical protein ABUL46_02800, partial [Chitinophaga rupis]